MNMIIGKKQIILASLVVGLGLAVYVNYQFAQADGHPPALEGRIGRDAQKYDAGCPD